jgi:hypothetical protein
MPSAVGTPIPPGVRIDEPAFVLKGWLPVIAHPNDRTDGMPISVKYVPLDYATDGIGDGSPAPTAMECDAPGLQDEYKPLPWYADNKVAWCLKIEGVEIPKSKSAHIHVNYEFRWLDTGSWGSSSVDPALKFRAGFAFKSTTVLELDEFPEDLEDELDHQLRKLPAAIRPGIKAEIMGQWDQTYSGDRYLGLAMAGERMTAIGGFVFGSTGSGIKDVKVRIFKSPPASGVDRCGDTYTYGGNYVASDLTDEDGFYFIWENGDNDFDGTNTFPSGYKYYIAICDDTPGQTALPFSQLYWPSRQLSSTLGSKQFAYEEFNVSGPTRLKITAQPVITRKNTSFTVKVTMLDAFGDVLTLDTGPTASSVSLSLLTPNPGGTLGSSSDPDLTKQFVNGVATWTDLRISWPIGPSKAGVYQIVASSSLPWVDEDDGVPFNVTN